MIDAFPLTNTSLFFHNVSRQNAQRPMHTIRPKINVIFFVVQTIKDTDQYIMNCSDQCKLFKTIVSMIIPYFYSMNCSDQCACPLTNNFPCCHVFSQLNAQ